MKRVVRAGVIFALLFSQLSIASNSANAELPVSPTRQVSFADSNTPFDGGMLSYTYGPSFTPCEGGFTNPKCQIVDNILTTTNTLALCDSKITIPCIEDVFAQNEKSDWIKGTSLGSRTSTWSYYDFTAKPEYELGPSNRNNLFSFAGIGDPTNNLFEVNPVMARKIIKGVLQDPMQLSMVIHAVYEDKNEAEPMKYFSEAKDDSERRKESNRCIDSRTYTTKCWKYASNPLTNKFKVVLRLPSQPSGWLSGRLLNPDVIFEKVAGATAQPFRLTVSGSPVPTPTFSKQYSYDVPAERAAWDKVGEIFDIPWRHKTASSIGLVPTHLDYFISMVKADPTADTATGIIDKWLVTMNWGENYGGGLGGCTNTGFLGYVGSNSLTYGSELPTYDAATGSLVYRVASPHFMPAGQEFTGIYAMVLNREYANCIWKLSGAAISASVEVLSEDGKPKVATASAKFNEKTVNFLATGFTFSSPTLRVKLVQDKPVVAKVTKVAKKITINCKKGTTIKKISGVNPKCPAGYVKK